MKKLKFFICFAAVLFLTTQFAAAQTLGDDPASEVNKASGRFVSDVDLFFGVNDWADLGAAKWFSFLQMDEIEPVGADGNPSTWSPIWEGGLALQLSRVYVALYYNGTFNRGVQSQGTETINTATGVTTNGLSLDTGFNWGTRTFTTAPGRIYNNNFYGVLVGFGNHGIKLTVQDTLSTIDVPVFTTAGDAANNVAPDAIGKYISRTGNIIPTLQWGAAQDMIIGKYATRPSASFALDIGFAESLLDLTDPDGTIHHLGNYDDNYLTPTISIDSGGIGFFKGEWGSLSFGASETFTFRIKGEGTESAIPWGNKLAPYAKFSYEPVDYFKLAAKLNVPVWVGWHTNTDYYFGVGARGDVSSVYNTPPTTTNLVGDWATLVTGFQLGLGFIDGITGKNTLFQKFNLNWGITVNLPAFATVGTVDDAIAGPDTVRQTKTNIWYPNTVLQTFTAGLTFFITDKILIDAGFDLTGFNWKNWGLTESVTLGRVLISVKH
jgi:hypothetical protein